MKFVYTEDQTMFRNSADRYGTDHWPATARETVLKDGLAGHCTAWKTMAELGWTLLGISEDRGGLGGSAIDVMALVERLGRHLVTVPFVTNCILVPSLIAEAEEGAFLIEGIAAGKLTAAAGLDEEQGGGSPAYVETIAKRTGSDWHLSGVKAHVEDGGHADWFVISARQAGEVRDADGIGLFLVAADGPGVTVNRYRAIDGHVHARVTLNHAPARALADHGQALPVIERALDLALCAHLAEATGSIEAANEATLEYLKTRKQFGTTIGSFQALQHRAVDMAVAQEEAMAMCWTAAHACCAKGAEAAATRQIAVSAAKVRVGQTGLYVGRQAVQLHGGIGFSEEHIVSHHLRRQMMLDMAHGGQGWHLKRFSQLTQG
ncbi:acyl-CoA dehydrogenase family protein [Pseudooceanicola nitratireducens]|uniref:acyl-CoA dehydrogenase family protein n=1 Tax=Pseudooceanicola nitratireducens TaxID=517719 RepID=UPI0023F0CA94|nr:acyl-CoA dehydrogenase family protein [Pseudooceanicola nitratireducens]